MQTNPLPIKSLLSISNATRVYMDESSIVIMDCSWTCPQASTHCSTQECPVDTHSLCKSKKSLMTSPCSRSIPEASLPTEEPELVRIASDPLVPDPPSLLSPRACSHPAMNIEPIRSVGPGGHVAVPRTGFAAGEGDQLPRGGLFDWQRREEFSRTTTSRARLV